MSHYETTFEHQHLPLGTEFTGEAIDFMKKKDEFVRYYHNYYKDEVHLQPFRKMVDERIRLGQIIKHEGLYICQFISHHEFSVLILL